MYWLDLKLYYISCRGFKLKIYGGFLEVNGNLRSRHGGAKKVKMSRVFLSTGAIVLVEVYNYERYSV